MVHQTAILMDPSQIDEEKAKEVEKDDKGKLIHNKKKHKNPRDQFLQQGLVDEKGIPKYPTPEVLNRCYCIKEVLHSANGTYNDGDTECQ